jgi:hypothetical protein
MGYVAATDTAGAADNGPAVSTAVLGRGLTGESWPRRFGFAGPVPWIMRRSRVDRNRLFPPCEQAGRPEGPP